MNDNCGSIVIGRRGERLRNGAWRAYFILALLPGLIPLTGCASWSYDRIHIGAPRSEYETIFPREQTRLTDLGICSLQADRAGRVDVFLILVTQDRRVAGKIWATNEERGFLGWNDRGFRLRGEIDARLFGAQEAGPIDTLRLLASQLSDYRGEKLALDAHSWIIAGLVRLMQCWPSVKDTGVSTERLTETLDRVPGGGTASLNADANGIVSFEYQFGKVSGK